MMAPLPTHSHADDELGLPRVRLDVRAGSGRPVSYEVGANDFLIGGSSGCDLCLPASNLPPVICQLARRGDGLSVRRITPVLPVLLNGSPLPANVTTPIASGDRLTIADLEITVVSALQPAIVVPRFVPLEAEVESGAAGSLPGPNLREEVRSLDEQRQQVELQESAQAAEWKRRDGELVRRARELDRQAEELESDRVLWYQRRQEIEQELERQRSSAGLAGIQKADLDARDRELTRVKEELSILRERLFQEYQERRDELARQQDELRDGSERLAADRASFDAELNRRWAVLLADVERHRERLEAEATGRRELLEEEFRQRRAAFESELAAKAARS